MVSFLVRVLGFLALAGGFAAFIVDGTRSIADSHVVQTGIGQTLQWLAPARFATIEQAFMGAHSWIWTLVVAKGLTVPTWLLMSILAALMLMLGRPRVPGIGMPGRR